jgi:hypothetical protein
MQATQKPAQTENTMADPDNIQQGDQTSPDKPGQAEGQEAKGPDTDDIQQGSGNQVEDGKPDLPGSGILLPFNENLPIERCHRPVPEILRRVEGRVI